MKINKCRIATLILRIDNFYDKLKDVSFFEVYRFYLQWLFTQKWQYFLVQVVPNALNYSVPFQWILHVLLLTPHQYPVTLQQYMIWRVLFLSLILLYFRFQSFVTEDLFGVVPFFPAQMVPWWWSAGGVLLKANKRETEWFDVVLDGLVSELKEGGIESNFLFEVDCLSLFLFHKL